MSVVKLRGIVLAESRNGESNKRITVLAKGAGKMYLNARGAKNTKSKLLAGTQLFSYCDFLAYKGQGFYSLTQAELIESFFGIRMDMAKLAEAAYMAELVSQTTMEGMEQDDILRLLLTALTVLEKKDIPPRLVSRIFEIKYLQLSGVLGDHGCTECGSTDNELFFDGREGAFLCRDHRRAGSFPLLKGAEKAIRYVTGEEINTAFGFTLSNEAQEQLEDILGQYIVLHLGIRLKSRDFGRSL